MLIETKLNIFIGIFSVAFTTMLMFLFVGLGVTAYVAFGLSAQFAFIIAVTISAMMETVRLVVSMIHKLLHRKE